MVSEPCSIRSSLCEPEVPEEIPGQGTLEKSAEQAAEISDIRSLDGGLSEFSNVRPNNIH